MNKNEHQHSDIQPYFKVTRNFKKNEQKMGTGNLVNIIDCKIQRINRIIQPLPDYRYATEQAFDQVRRDVFST